MLPSCQSTRVGAEKAVRAFVYVHHLARQTLHSDDGGALLPYMFNQSPDHRFDPGDHHCKFNSFLNKQESTPACVVSATFLGLFSQVGASTFLPVAP